jgi:2-oxoglutarate ferredoxin oxidoreductase subunit alpha
LLPHSIRVEKREEKMADRGKKKSGLLSPGWHFLQGNEACAEGAIAAGCRFYAGYPITPSSEIMERMAARLNDVGGAFIQMEDEIASISAMLGASWSGAKAMTATSGPGFSLMQEAVGYAAFTETPCVIIDVQRAGPCTGQATRVGSGDIMQAKWGSHGDYQALAFSPWSVQEMFDFTVRAFNHAERFRNPALVLADEAIGHLRESIRVPERVEVWNRKKVKGGAVFDTDEEDGIPSMPAFGEGLQLSVTGSTHDGWGVRKADSPEVHAKLVKRINEKILKARKSIVETESYFLEDAEAAVIAYGFTARSSLYAVKALRREGKKIGLLRLKTLWPFPGEEIQEVGKGVQKFILPEMNLGQVAGEVRKVFCGDIFSYSQTNGEVIGPEEIIAFVRRIGS